MVPQSDDKPDGSVQPAVNGRGVENRGLDSIDLDDPGNSQVFSTDTSKVGPYGTCTDCEGHKNNLHYYLKKIVIEKQHEM